MKYEDDLDIDEELLTEEEREDFRWDRMTPEERLLELDKLIYDSIREMEPFEAYKFLKSILHEFKQTQLFGAELKQIKTMVENKEAKAYDAIINALQKSKEYYYE